MSERLKEVLRLMNETDIHLLEMVEKLKKRIEVLEEKERERSKQ